MIQVSVIFPLYRAAPIGWFGLESLCHQQGIDFDWELVVTEEAQPQSMGVKQILKYQERLVENGCKAIKYISLPHWIPLSMKYKIMAQECTPSKVFFIQAADYWSPPYRMAKTLSLIEKGYDWVHGRTMPMYDLKSDTVFMREKNPKKFWMALSMGLAKKLPLSSKKKGCDQYLIDSCKANKGGSLNMVQCNTWGEGIVVHGLNNLSNKFQKFRAEKTDSTLGDFVPSEIAERLRGQRGQAQSWSITIPSSDI